MTPGNLQTFAIRLAGVERITQIAWFGFANREPSDICNLIGRGRTDCKNPMVPLCKPRTFRHFSKATKTNLQTFAIRLAGVERIAKSMLDLVEHGNLQTMSEGFGGFTKRTFRHLAIHSTPANRIANV